MGILGVPEVLVEEILESHAQPSYQSHAVVGGVQDQPWLWLSFNHL